MIAFNPTTDREKLIRAETLRQYNTKVGFCRARETNHFRSSLTARRHVAVGPNLRRSRLTGRPSRIYPVHVLYGILLGFLAVATYRNYSTVDISSTRRRQVCPLSIAIRAPLSMQPRMHRRSSQKNANPRHRDKRCTKQDPYDPNRIVIEPIHQAATIYVIYISRPASLQLPGSGKLSKDPLSGIPLRTTRRARA